MSINLIYYGREEEMFDQEEFWRRYVGLRDSEAVAVLESNSYIRSLEKGEKIIREGEVVTEVAFIITGVLKAVYIDQTGKEKVYCFGYISGEAAISVTHLGIGIKSICTVEAITESGVLCVPMTCLIKLTKDNLDVARIYNKMLSISLKKVIEYNRILADFEVQERYQWFKETYPGLFEMVRKKDVASFLGMAPESLSCILRENSAE